VFCHLSFRGLCLLEHTHLNSHSEPGEARREEAFYYPVKTADTRRIRPDARVQTDTHSAGETFRIHTHTSEVTGNSEYARVYESL